MTSSRLSSAVCPVFAPVHRDIKAHAHTHYWLNGGRGSTKSSFAAIELVLLILAHQDVNAVVVRKVANTMRDSVYAQIMWALDTLGVASAFSASLSPMEITYRPTGQRIMFRGADKPEKLKSLKPRTGYIGVIWFEELDQFYGMAEIRSINQSLMRGGEHFWAFYTYNPPRSRDSWANRESLTHRDDRLIHTSDYRDVPEAWLGEQFITEAHELRKVNETAYRHEYLGEVVGTGGQVFDNLTIREITDEEIAEFDRIYNGVDWGYFPDPWVFVRCHYDHARRTLYIFDEASASRASNEDTARIVRGKLGEIVKPDGTIERYARGEIVTCDSAEPKSIRDYREYRIEARPCVKGPGSVEYGMKWLSGRASIVIDPRRAPVSASEFRSYEFERTRDGEYLSGYPDANNHAIDACRYAVGSLVQSGAF